MNKEEVQEIVSNAIELTEKQEDVKNARAKTALWLYEHYNVAIKGIVINTNDKMPYMCVEFINDDNEVEETYINMEKYSNMIGANDAKTK